MSRMFRCGSLISLPLAAALVGCGSARTDTGYEPHRLTMNGNQIRGLYAPAFSPEAQSAKEEQKQTLKTAHPGPAGLGY